MRFDRSSPSSKPICRKLWRLRSSVCRKRWRLEMTVTVQIPTALRRLTSGTGQVKCAAANLGELFCALDQQFPDLKAHLRDEAGEIRRFLNVYVNEEDIRFLGGKPYPFSDGDEGFLGPAIAGGSA